MIHASMQVTDFHRRLLAKFSNADSSGLWADLFVRLDTMVGALFRRRGGLYGRDFWPRIKPTLIGSPRIGTDGKQYGVYRGNTNPLHASGKYRKSFKLLSKSPTKMRFGSRHKLAHIMPYREWKDAQTGMCRYIARYAMPDPHSNAFNHDVELVHVAYVRRITEEAKKEAGLEQIV